MIVVGMLFSLFKHGGFMKRVLTVKHPHSVSLFHFCKEALSIKHEHRIRIIDQDVGAIIGFEPADCSHWKRGQKDVRALRQMQLLAEHFQIDENIPISVALGEITAEEGVQEYVKTHFHNLNSKKAKELKKDFFTDPGHWGAPNLEKSFDEIFAIHSNLAKEFSAALVAKTGVSRAPIDVTKVFDTFEDITLEANSRLKKVLDVKVMGAPKDPKPGGTTTVRRRRGATRTPAASSAVTFCYKGDLESPLMRFILLKELYLYLHKTMDVRLGELASLPQETAQEHACIFAMCTLIPEEALSQEVQALTQEFDVIQQLADVFVVPKSVMNQRLWHLDSGES